MTCKMRIWCVCNIYIADIDVDIYGFVLVYTLHWGCCDMERFFGCVPLAISSASQSRPEYSVVTATFLPKFQWLFTVASAIWGPAGSDMVISPITSSVLFTFGSTRTTLFKGQSINNKSQANCIKFIPCPSIPIWMAPLGVIETI